MDGRPKKRYTDLTHAESDAYHLQRRLKQSVSVYKCAHCWSLHVGRTSTRMKYQANLHPSLVMEIGDRAFWNLLAENVPVEQLRLQSIARRFRRIERDMPA